MVPRIPVCRYSIDAAHKLFPNSCLSEDKPCKFVILYYVIDFLRAQSPMHTSGHCKVRTIPSTLVNETRIKSLTIPLILPTYFTVVFLFKEHCFEIKFYVPIYI